MSKHAGPPEKVHLCHQDSTQADGDEMWSLSPGYVRFKVCITAFTAGIRGLISPQQ